MPIDRACGLHLGRNVHAAAVGRPARLKIAENRLNFREELQPALAEGHVVICDRFTDSTLAYQGYGRGLGPEMCEELRAFACEGLRPDLTFVIDVPAEIGLGRSLRRATDATRFEQEDIEFHNRVRDAFLRIAAADFGRYAEIDGQMEEDDVESEIRRRYFESFEIVWEARSQ